MKLKKEIGTNLRIVRESLNYTQSYVASQLGIATNTYSLMERGLAQLTLDRIETLAQLYQRSPLELIGSNTLEQQIASSSDCSSLNIEQKALMSPAKDEILCCLQKVETQIKDLQKLIDSIKNAIGR